MEERELVCDYCGKRCTFTCLQSRYLCSDECRKNMKKFQHLHDEFGYNITAETDAPMRGKKGKDSPLFGKPKSANSLINFLAASRGSNNYQSRAVFQMDLMGNIIKKFDCISDAAREVGAVKNKNGIINCCKNKKHYHTCKGYKWKYV